MLLKLSRFFYFIYQIWVGYYIKKCDHDSKIWLTKYLIENISL